MPRDAMILAPLINWRRASNIPTIIAALRAQTIPIHISLVECSPDSDFALPPDTAKLADSFFVIRDNLGPSSRFLPPLAIYQHPYTLFTTDDFSPGPNFAAFMLATAGQLSGKFATIGQDGRRVHLANTPDAVGGEWVLGGSRARLTDDPQPTDVVTTWELARTRDIPHAIQFRADLWERLGEGVSLFEDDMVLCLGLQKALGYPSYITAHPGDESRSWRARKLPAPHALCARPDHRAGRDRFVRQAMELGWRSLC